MTKTAKAQILPFKLQEAEPDGDDVVFEEARERPERAEQMRMIEAILFASSEPVAEKVLADRLSDEADIASLLEELRQVYAGRGINLVRIADHWAFRTADDLAFLLQKEAIEQKRLSRAALEVLAIIAYHQPVTRTEIEEIRGVVTSKGTLDVLLEAGWVRMRGRRRTPGRPVTYGTTLDFLDQFGIAELKDLPGLDELKGAGLLQSNLPANFRMPMPHDGDEPAEDEDPLTPEDLEELGLLPPKAGDDED